MNNTSSIQGEVPNPRISRAIDAWLGELARVGAPGVGDCWREHTMLLAGDTVHSWFETVGGLTLENVHTEFELLLVAHEAPNDLLFGLAHGKLADALAYRSAIRTPAHPITLTQGARNPIHNMLFDKVLARGQHLSSQAQEHLDEDFPEFEDVLLEQSREDTTRLLHHAHNAKTPFALGEITSWLLTNHRLHNPHKYTSVLASSMMGGLSIDAVAEYCAADVPAHISGRVAKSRMA